VKLVPPIALFSGSALIVLAVLVAIVLWIDAASKPQVLLPQPPPKAFSESLAQATSLEGVKQTCAAVAQMYDTQSQIIQTQNAYVSHVLWMLLWGTIGVGFIIGPIFLYIYFATRRHVSAPVGRAGAL